MGKSIKNYDVAIVGAGPAGMMAAVRAAECGASVVVLEKNRMPGIKLLMTGKERCNITNDQRDIKEFAANYGKNGRFLYAALHHFGVEATISFFHNHKLMTKVERGGRVFPESDRSRDVLELFIRLLNQNNADLVSNCGKVRLISGKNEIGKISVADDLIKAGSYIVCTGGLSYPKTGSSGDGYKWAEKLGHSVVKPEPALTPIIVREQWVKDLEGISLRNVKVAVFQNNRKIDERFGEALFTDSGMSGPIILDMSKSVGRLLDKGRVDLFIDLKPALDFNILDKRLIRDLDKFKNKRFKNILPGLLPRKMIPVVLRLTGIDGEKKGHSISKEERKRLKVLLKEFPLTVKGLVGFGKAVITAGGISLKEIDPGTMRSKIIKNLYFAGEVLDLDGPTGGYNLQVCWSTGYLAGEKAAGA